MDLSPPSLPPPSLAPHYEGSSPPPPPSSTLLSSPTASYGGGHSRSTSRPRRASRGRKSYVSSDNEEDDEHQEANDRKPRRSTPGTRSSRRRKRASSPVDFDSESLFASSPPRPGHYHQQQLQQPPPSSPPAPASQSRKRKEPTVTPKRFQKFFTPRSLAQTASDASSLSLRSHSVDAKRRALTSSTENANTALHSLAAPNLKVRTTTQGYANPSSLSSPLKRSTDYTNHYARPDALDEDDEHRGLDDLDDHGQPSMNYHRSANYHDHGEYLEVPTSPTASVVQRRATRSSVLRPPPSLLATPCLPTTARLRANNTILSPVKLSPLASSPPPSSPTYPAPSAAVYSSDCEADPDADDSTLPTRKASKAQSARARRRESSPTKRRRLESRSLARASSPSAITAYLEPPRQSSPLKETHPSRSYSPPLSPSPLSPNLASSPPLGPFRRPSLQDHIYDDDELPMNSTEDNEMDHDSSNPSQQSDLPPTPIVSEGPVVTLKTNALSTLSPLPFIPDNTAPLYLPPTADSSSWTWTSDDSDADNSNSTEERDVVDSDDDACLPTTYSSFPPTRAPVQQIVSSSRSWSLYNMHRELGLRRIPRQPASPFVEHPDVACLVSHSSTDELPLRDYSQTSTAPTPALPFSLASTPNSSIGSLQAVGDSTGYIRLVNTDRKFTPLSATTDSTSFHPFAFFQAHTSAVMGLDFSRDHLLASAGADRRAQVLDLTSQCQVYRLEGVHTDSLREVKFMPNQATSHLLATSGRDGTVCVWDLRTRAANQQPAVGLGQSAEEADSIQLHYYDELGRPLAIPLPGVPKYISYLNRFLQVPSPGGPGKGNSEARRSSTTTIAWFPQRTHLIASAGEANASVKLWDIRHVQRAATRGRATINLSAYSLPLSISAEPTNDVYYSRSYGVSSLNFGHSQTHFGEDSDTSYPSSGQYLYAVCRNGSVYALPTSHLILGQAQELETQVPRERAGRLAQGLGPSFAFRHPALRVDSFWIKSAVSRPWPSSLAPSGAEDSTTELSTVAESWEKRDEMLAVGNSLGIPIIFPTNARRYPSRQHELLVPDRGRSLRRDSSRASTTSRGENADFEDRSRHRSTSSRYRSSSSRWSSDHNPTQLPIIRNGIALHHNRVHADDPHQLHLGAREVTGVAWSITSAVLPETATFSSYVGHGHCDAERKSDGGRNKHLALSAISDACTLRMWHRDTDRQRARALQYAFSRQYDDPVLEGWSWPESQAPGEYGRLWVSQAREDEGEAEEVRGRARTTARPAVRYQGLQIRGGNGLEE